MLNSKTARLDGVGGGVPSLTVSDLNAAISHCHPLGIEMLLNRVCGEDKASERAHGHLLKEVESLAKHWRVRDKENRLAALSSLAIFETNSTPVCPACKGRKFNRFHRPCAPCKGEGKYIIRDSHRARALGVSHSTWSRVWNARYTEVLQLISDREGRALREIHHKIGRH